MHPKLSWRLLRRLARRLLHQPLLLTTIRGRTNQRGDVLDRQLELMVKLQHLAGDLKGQTVEERRQSMTKSCWLAAAPVPEVPTEDDVIAGQRVRWYHVDGAEHALMWLHGGGWVVGGIESHDALCHRLARSSGRTIVSVDYPLAPERPFPAAVHAVAELWEAFEHGAFAGVAMGGDSAGGNLTAAVARLVQGMELQFLLYPGLDATRSRPSHREFFETDLILDGASIDFYLGTYAPEPLHPLASPVLAEDLQGLPPAVIAVAGFDPLRDEGIWYAERLEQAGVEVQLFDFTSLCHGFGNFDGLVDAAGDAMDTLGDAIRPS